jgi:hypothetical protein
MATQGRLRHPHYQRRAERPVTAMLTTLWAVLVASPSFWTQLAEQGLGSLAMYLVFLRYGGSALTRYARSGGTLY